VTEADLYKRLRHFCIFLYNEWLSLIAVKTNDSIPYHTAHNTTMLTAMGFVFKSFAVLIGLQEGIVCLNGTFCVVTVRKQTYKKKQYNLP
jgi:hypothetical protein